jgi:mannose-1-phosphate guanylyltransferase
MNSNFLLVMAGGIGSRFWPLSRKSKPKQFHDILGSGTTLIQQTVERFNGIIPNENIFIVANRIHRDLLLEQLPYLKDSNFLLEPHGKNTAPCIAFGALKALIKDPEANLVVCPADHIILEKEKFLQTIELSLNKSQEEKYLITLGIQPTKPETGYGYIQYENNSPDLPKKVLRFTEKPDRPTAESFIANGDYLWNSGIFIWKAEKIMEEFRAHLPKMFNDFNEIIGDLDSSRESKAIEEVYKSCESISIDYGILERSSDVWVIPSEFGWSDLGTWKSLFDMVEKDENINHLEGHIKTYDVKDCLMKIDRGKLLVVQGLEGYIVIQEGDTTMICKKENEQMVKSFVEDLKSNPKGSEYL